MDEAHPVLQPLILNESIHAVETVAMASGSFEVRSGDAHDALTDPIVHCTGALKAHEGQGRVDHASVCARSSARGETWTVPSGGLRISMLVLATPRSASAGSWMFLPSSAFAKSRASSSTDRNALALSPRESTSRAFCTSLRASNAST